MIAITLRARLNLATLIPALLVFITSASLLWQASARQADEARQTAMRAVLDDIQADTQHAMLLQDREPVQAIANDVVTRYQWVVSLDISDNAGQLLAHAQRTAERPTTVLERTTDTGRIKLVVTPSLLAPANNLQPLLLALALAGVIALAASQALAAWVIRPLRHSHKVALAAEQAATQAREQFLGLMAHELRSPMSAAAGFLEYITTPIGQSDADKAARQIRRALRLVETALNFEKARAGAYESTPTQTDMAQLWQEVVDAAQIRATNKGLLLSTHGLSAVPAWCNVDGAALGMVLANLLDNAVKYTPRGSVTLTAGWSAGHLTVAVSDSGAGIPLEQLPRLFEPFQQASNVVLREYGGVGLGLALCKKLADLMRGTLSAENTERGARFTLTLPCPACAPLVPENQQPLLRLDNKKVLVVDDDDDYREITIRHLEKVGALAFGVNSAQAALTFLDHNAADAIVCDYHMPQIDGAALIAVLRESERMHGDAGARIVVQTNDTRDHSRQACLNAGADEVLIKPASAAQLAAALQGSDKEKAVS